MLLNVKISTYQRLSRTARFRRKRSSRSEDIADSAEGMNHRPALVQFGAQAMDEHVHNIGLWIEAVIKNVFEDHGFGDRPVGVAHEIFEEGELAGLQLDCLATALHFAGEQIHGQ